MTVHIAWACQRNDSPFFSGPKAFFHTLNSNIKYFNHQATNIAHNDLLIRMFKSFLR